MLSMTSGAKGLGLDLPAKPPGRRFGRHDCRNYTTLRVKIPNESLGLRQAQRALTAEESNTKLDIYRKV